ncbi:triose-phosphate isomerase [Candidatus Sumerlaeota bacterium]|nr:triose-phosphate isomerase [Candidatus Sumerlaeota bacterium]
MRKPIIAGNWKMNGALEEAQKLAQGVVDALGDAKNADVAVCPPFTALSAVSMIVKGTNVKLGAQNCNENDSGAYTGEISPVFLKELGVDYCIIGHSERRQYYAETDAKINAKAKALYQHGIIPIICVGELLDERKAGRTLDVVLGQVRGCLAELPREKMIESVIAYEPVWAIGTGEVATPEQAQEVHAAIRAELAKLFDQELADAVRLQYGGSMKPDNAEGLMAKADIDGGLIGGAALKADSFAGIVACC